MSTNSRPVLTPARWYMFFGFWVLISAVFVVRAILAADISPLIADTDDAMRLVVIRDWLAGQNWYDHIQYRLNTPFGASIHWSRLIDVPVGGLIVLLTPFFGDSAPFAAAYVWPLLLLGVLLYLSMRMSVYLLGPDAMLPGLVLPVLSAAVMVEFGPGRVDHHNVQIILVLALLYTSILAWRSPRWALGAGLVAATSLAIGTEGLPQIATAVAVFALFWVIEAQKGKTMALFGAGFALATLANFVIYLPPESWFNPACDVLSVVYLSAALGVGLIFAVLPLFRIADWRIRLGVGAGLGLGLVVLLAVLFPGCRAGPYSGVDPYLVENWLARISEAKPVWDSFAALPAYTVGIVVPPVLALGVAVWAFSRQNTQNRHQWLVLGFYLAVGVAVMLIQVRGARLVAGMAAPAGAYVILAARRRYLEKAGIANTAMLLGSWLAFSGLALAIMAALVLPRGANEVDYSAGAPPGKAACLQPGAFAALGALAPQRIMAPADLGAHLLLYTPHSVVGAPYHRNQRGLMDTFGFFNQPLEEAKTILEERDISLVVTCPAMPEMNGMPDAADTSFVRRAATGDLPDWLQDVSVPGQPLKIYQVVNP